jgi:hypothetical protein
MARPSSKDKEKEKDRAPAKPHGMEYNTQLEHLIIPEYGRNIQNLVEYACTIKSKDERNKVANAIIGIMSRLNPNLRDLTDFKHKLWDHLFIISKFKLDVDSPYPKPPKEILTSKPENVPYPSQNIRFKHYGKAVERLIEKASGMKAGEEKTAFIEAIANLMKKNYLIWNRNTVDDRVILQELEALSKGKLKVEDGFQMTSTHDILSKAGRRDEGRGREDHGGRDRDRGRDRGRHGHGRNRHRRGR